MTQRLRNLQIRFKRSELCSLLHRRAGRRYVGSEAVELGSRLCSGCGSRRVRRRTLQAQIPIITIQTCVAVVPCLARPGSRSLHTQYIACIEQVICAFGRKFIPTYERCASAVCGLYFDAPSARSPSMSSGYGDGSASRTLIAASATGPRRCVSLIERQRSSFRRRIYTASELPT